MTNRTRNRRRSPFAEPLIRTAEGFVELAASATNPDESELLTAKAQLASQLERLDDAVEAAFKALTPDEFADVVWRLANPGRTDFLRELRLPPARKPVPIAAGNGLTRLRTWDPDHRLNAARYITLPVVRGLMAHLRNWLDSRDDDALRRALTADAGQANAVRLMVLSHWYDLPELVAALRLALTGGLALPTWPADVVDGIVAACERLEPLWVEATRVPDHQHGEDDPAGTDPDDRGSLASDPTSWDDLLLDDADDSGADDELQPDAPGDSNTPVLLSRPSLDSDVLTQTASQVRDALDSARASAHRVVSALDAAQVPSPDLLEPIHELGRVTEYAQSILIEVGASVEPGDNCALVAAALDTAAATAAHERMVRDQLTRLTRLAGPQTNREVLDAVQQLATTLLHASVWDEAQQRHVAGLIALLRLIDDVAAGQTNGVVELHSTAQQQLPQGLAPVLVIALLGQLSTLSADVTIRPDSELPPGTTPVAGPADTAVTVTLLEQRTGTRQTRSGSDSAAAAFSTADVADQVVSAPPSTVAAAPTSTGSAAFPTGSAGSAVTADPTAAVEADSSDGHTARDLGPNTDPTSAETIASPAAVAGRDDPGPVDPTRGSEQRDTGSEPAPLDVDRSRDQGSRVDAAGDQLVASLLGGRRYCLAYHAATAMGIASRAQALRLLTFSEAVRSETGPTAAAMRAALDELHVHHFDGDRPAQLAVLAAAVRAALVTADPNAGEVITSLVSTLHELPHLAKLAGVIGTASARGLLSSSAMLTALAPIAGADRDIAAAAEAAVAERDRTRTLRFARANIIADRWWGKDGVIGRALDIAANDQRLDVEVAAERLRKLAKREDIARELARDDAALRGTSSRPMEGAAKRRLVDHAREALDAVGVWVDAVRANPDGDSDTLPVPALLAELRSQVREEWVAAATELHAAAATSKDVMLAAVATACQHSLDRTVLLLDGKKLAGVEPEPNVVLNRELLRSPSLPFDTGLNPTRAVTTHDIEVAASTSWHDAFDARLADEDYLAARIIVDAVAESGPDGVGEMLDRLEQNTSRSRAELRVLRTEVSAQVEKAARLGQLGQAAYAQVLAQLEAARIDRDDLGAVRGQLVDIRDNLPQYAEAAKDALWSRATVELNKAAGLAASSTTVRVADNAAELIKDRIDAGDLATAEEYLLSALVGEDPPSAERSVDLAAFMAVPDALAEGLTSALVKAARDGTEFAGLDFSELSTADRVSAGDGLDTWLQMRHDRQQRNQRMKYAIASALRLAGIEFTGDRQPHGLSGSPNRKWVDLTGVKRVGEPLVPAFGSLTGDRLRLMLCWGVQDARTLLTWVTQDQSNDPVLIALFATLPLTQRRVLAKACAERPDRPVIVLDDAALAYLAARGGGRFATTERILLPFAATNPYHPNATGNVPGEMFYGRRDERSKILAPYGTSLIYGGRQLGKSALLQAAARQFEITPDRVAVYLSLPGGFGSTAKVDDLWDMIAARLAERGITTPRKRVRDVAQYVETTVTTWLNSNPHRKLLLLLDECDGFFDADAKTGFAHTTRLRDLMNSTDRAFKPVFAGLHQVQRFAHLPNQPLAHAHFGDPIAIGPLSPDPAYGLMFTPMETLGISFASDELIHRVLAYCNYQPKLLQLVGEALVREAFNRRGNDGPPYVIGDEELERVIGSDTVRQKVRETVQLTLNLDSRYKLIALVVALAALEHGADHAIGTMKLREECLAWWPEGFAGQGADEFRSLLSEMSGLGVLAETGGRWRLRSSNVLRLLGSADAIEEELCGAEWRNTVTALSAEQARRTLTEGLVSPMAEKQLATLIERGNQVRIVVGTPATGVDRVSTLLHEEADRIGARFTLHPVSSPANYRKELRGGVPGDRHRVVLCDLSKTRPDKAIEELREVGVLTPAAGVTRSVVAVVDARISELFTRLGSADLGDITDQLVPLRRLSRDGLRSWVAENDKVSCFSDAASQNQLMEATGGWTVLIDEAATIAASGRGARRVCEAIMSKLGNAETAAMLVDQVGLANHLNLTAAFQELVNYDDPLTADDLAELFEVAGCGGARSADALRYLDVVVERPEDGTWVPEPVFAAAWNLVRAQ